ncbi:MAG: metallophosphoesterase [Cellvibrionaceae bacterium]|nr:metallophosphoesterase [Cellvibrionaceae bacterium]
MAQDMIKVAAVGDLHCSKNSAGQLRPLFSQAAEMADMLLLCGDLTDYGLAEEAKILADELTALKKCR